MNLGDDAYTNASHLSKSLQLLIQLYMIVTYPGHTWDIPGTHPRHTRDTPGTHLGHLRGESRNHSSQNYRRVTCGFKA